MQSGALQPVSPSSPKTRAGLSRKKLWLIILSALLVLFSMVFFLLLHALLDSSRVYKGVRIQGQDIGGLTRQELMTVLENRYSKGLEDIPLTIFSESYERDITLADLGVKIDIGAMTEKAFEQGRKGNFFQRLSQIASLRSKPVNIEIILDLNSPVFESFLDEVCNAVRIAVTPPNIVITEDRAVLCTGIPGKEANREALKADIMKAVNRMEPAFIAIPVVDKLPPSIDVETTLKTLNQEASDAQFIKTSRTTYNIKPHQMGRSLDKAKLMDVVNYLSTRKSQEYEEIVLPIEFTKPAVTEDQLKAEVFRDRLSSFTTSFMTDSENNKNRGINIGIAAQSIDGTILLPGEEFSFNDVVGPRTAEKGYKVAHIYAEGQVQDGIGGGICQVSTTLYNAILRANLAITERHNHMFTVGYVPLGLDAAVSYGYYDLKFKNNTSRPLEIKAYTGSSNTLTFEVYSTNDYPGLNVKLASKIVKKIPIAIQYIDNADMPKGSEIVSDNGLEGYVVDTFMKVFNGDTLIKEEKLGRSVYQMIPMKIMRGTAPSN